MALPERLRAVISSVGTIEEFAAELDEPAQRIKDVLRGKQKPPADLLTKLHLRYGVDINWLLIGDLPTKKKPAQLAVYLSVRQRALVDAFDAADESGKRVIEGAAALAAKGEAPTTGGISLVSNAQRSIQIGSVGGKVKMGK